MRRILSLAIAALLGAASTVASAEVVSPEVAKRTAENFLSLDSEWRGEGDATIRLVEEGGEPAYYVIEYSEGGWVIVSAQSSSRPVIAYNSTDAYVAPEPMQAVLDASAKRIVEVARLEASVEHEGWSRDACRAKAEGIDIPDIEPLITVNLNQTSPYNSQCPTVDGERCMVGCVAVGMAQAMMVQRYPERPVGRYSYNDANTGSHAIDYDAEKPYDWDAMLASDKTGNYDEVARLLYHCGVSVNMGYGVDGSGTGDTPVPKALVRNFCYDENLIQLVSRPESDDEWLSILLEQMFLGRVIIYFGAGDMGGHCWNLDGWKQSSQMVHVNWGWGGYGNAYFDIGNMRDSYQGMDFPNYNTAILGVGVSTTAPYGITLSTTKFVAGTAAGVALADVKVMCEDPEAVLEFEIKGAKNVLGVHGASPYSVVDGKIVSNKTVENSNSFKYMLMKVTNTHSGESFEKEFTIQITQGDGAVDAVMSDAMRVYPSVAHSYITVEAPVAGGEYAIYSVSGAQVAEGQIAGYKADVEVSSLAAGTYILRYTHNEGVGVKTFIKK